METVDPKRAVHQITQRLSLRKPQAEALRRLDTIVTDIDPKKDTDIDLARDAVRSAFGNLADADFEEFERGFTFSTPEQVKVARTVLDQVLPQVSKQVRSIQDLNDPKIVEKIAETAMTVTAQEEGLFASVTKEQAVAVASLRR